MQEETVEKIAPEALIPRKKNDELLKSAFKDFIFIDNEDINSNGEALMSSIKELNNYE